MYRHEPTGRSENYASAAELLATGWIWLEHCLRSIFDGKEAPEPLAHEQYELTGRSAIRHPREGVDPICIHEGFAGGLIQMLSSRNTSLTRIV